MSTNKQRVIGFKRRLLFLVVGLYSLTSSCAFDGLSLDVSADDPAFDHIARRLDITVLSGPDGYEGDPDIGCSTEACDPASFALAIAIDCFNRSRISISKSACLNHLAAVDAWVCSAHSLLRVVESPMSSDLRISGIAGENGSGGIVRVPPQDPESNSELARLAHEHASLAVSSVFALFGTDPVSGCPETEWTTRPYPDDSSGEISQLTVSEELVSFYREAVELSQQAATHMAASGAAVSDAAYSRRTDDAEASADTLAPFASRTAAAHMLLGGAFGLPAIEGVEDEGFSTRSTLSAEAQRALELIRAAAIDPARITSGDIPIDEVVYAGSPEGIAYRLGRMQSWDALRDATSADAVYELLGVSRTGFTEAREHLREEIRAFARSRLSLPAEPLPDGTTTDDAGIVLFAGTRTPPRQLPSSYWSAIVRYDDTPQPEFLVSFRTYDDPPPWYVRPETIGTGTSEEIYYPAGDTWGNELRAMFGDPRVKGGRRTVASTLDQAYRDAPVIMERLCPGGTCSDDALARARDNLAGLLGELGANPELSPVGDEDESPDPGYDDSLYLKRARACVFVEGPPPFSEPAPGAVPTFDVRLDVEAPHDAELLVVLGHEGLQCALDGFADGRICDAALWSAYQAQTDGWVVEDGHLTTRVRNVPVLDRPNDDTMTLFIVRRRSDASSDAAEPGAGEYEQYVGFVLPFPVEPGRGGYRYCAGAIVSPELDRQAADLIQPSPDGLRPAVSCAGLPSNLRIPLENELTTDDISGAPGMESSWRHYLDLARRSADEADRLGEDVIRTGLEMDLRAEAAADELSRLCGVSINLTSIAAELDTEDGPARTTGTPCGELYRQEGDTCVLDPVLYAASRSGDDADMARLATCLGTDRVPFATLGDTPLCAWDGDPGGPGGYCEPEGSRRCPYPADSTGACADTPSGATPISIGQTIGLFQRPDEEPEPQPDRTNFPCEALSALREVSSLRDLERVFGYLSYQDFRREARSLDWQAAVGDYSSVRYAGSTRFRTGSVGSSESRWPAGMAPTGACPSGLDPLSDPRISDTEVYTGPLFCIQGVTDREARSRMNDLLARAVLAARIFTGQGLSGMLFPYYARNRAHEYRTVDGSFEWDPVRDSSPLAFTSRVGTFHIDHKLFPADTADHYESPLSDFGSLAAYIVNDVSGESGTGCNSIPDGAEWTACPYDISGDFGDALPCRVFDDVADCDDFGSNIGDEDVPFIVREADDGLALADARAVAAANWDDTLRTYIMIYADEDQATRVRPPAGASVTELTNYYDSWEDSGRSCGDLREYEDCVDDEGARRLMPGGNHAFIGGGGLTLNDLFNGVELACWAARDAQPISSTNCDAPAEINDLSDAYRFQGFLECRANEISGPGSEGVVRDLPRRVVDSLREGGPGQYGADAGEFDAQVREIRASLLELSTHQHDTAADLRAYAAAIRALDSAASISGRQKTIEDLLFVGRTFDRVTQCVVAMTGIAGIDAAAVPGKATAAASTCANAVVQFALDAAVLELRQQNIDDELIAAFARFDRETAEFQRSMEDRALAIRAALERFEGALARLRTTQLAARRALARALLLTDEDTGAHFTVNRVYRARYNTALTRYRNAHRRAVRSAFIARIALEQRLGMGLAELDADLFSDEPPSAWVDTLCTLPSIDYDRIRSATPSGTGERSEDDVDFSTPEGYSGAYVGDYVRRLEDVFETYSFAQPFREGTDTAVISLRDDVLQIREECELPSPSLLFNGGRFDVYASDERPGWQIDGCHPELCAGEDCGCLSPERMDAEADTEAPGSLADDRYGRPSPYRVSFGDAPVVADDTALRQVLELPPGRYRLSWFVHPTTDGTASFVATDAAGASLNAASDAEYVEGLEGGWERRWLFFDVPSVDLVETPSTLSINLWAEPGKIFELAGAMVEDMGEFPPSVSEFAATAPGAFIESDDRGMATVRGCIDVDGDDFRREAWSRGCVRVCRDGYDGSCSEAHSESRCYREISFDIASDGLSRLLLQGDAGFAAGNHNYRIESLGVNMVGTGLRTCAAGGTTGCSAQGSVSYSVMHLGPYLVRNAQGALYSAPLFPGRLESARALAAERYLTNPLSNADRSLIEPYTRYELQGRPLWGTLVLRVWDHDSFNFDRLEDVQLMLRYRYWQHQR